MGRYYPATGGVYSGLPKRQAILEAALELFADRGFHGTAVPLVAHRAGVGAGTVYRYFASKESLVNELFQHWKEQLGRALLEGFPVKGRPRDQFHHVWQGLHAFAAAHPRVLAFLELHHHGDYLDDRSRAVQEAVLAPARAFILEAQRKKAIRPMHPEALMALVYGGFVGLQRASWEGRLSLSSSLVAATEETVWEAIKR
jgi:AcrR family transcriptional regulator